MKKTVLILAALIWMLIAQGAMAFDFDSLPREFDISDLSDENLDVLEFEKLQLAPGQYQEVYSGPGEHYYRCADGKAGVSTSGDVLCAGRVGKWLLVKYQKNDGGASCVGYIDSEKLKKAPDCDELHFESIPVFMWGNVYLMAAPSTKSECIAMLECRQQATLLAWHADAQGECCMDVWSGLDGWAYIETVVDGQPVRGFINPYELDSYRIGDERAGFGTVTEEKLKALYAYRYRYLKWGAAALDGYFAAGLTADGKVCTAGEDMLPEMKNWEDIVAISLGREFAVGLRSDGTVVATGCNEFGQCDVGDWSEIVAISAGGEHTVGLRADGTVVMAGSTMFQQDMVRVWDQIVEISAGDFHTVGLRADGTVVAAGGEFDGESEFDWMRYCDAHYDSQWEAEYWSRLSMIVSQGCSTVGVRCNGSVVFGGDRVNDQDKAQEWDCIENIGMGVNSVYGVDSDGYLNNTWTSDVIRGWYNVLFLAASDTGVLGVQRDGTVLHAEGWVYEDEMDEFKKMMDEIDQWNSIGLPEDSAVFTF